MISVASVARVGVLLLVACGDSGGGGRASDAASDQSVAAAGLHADLQLPCPPRFADSCCYPCNAPPTSCCQEFESAYRCVGGYWVLACDPGCFDGVQCDAATPFDFAALRDLRAGN